MARAFTIAAAMWLAAAALVHAAELSSVPDPMRVVAVYGATLGMPAAEARALAPSIVDGHACEPQGDNNLFLLECGPYRMTAEFTQAGRAWHLSAAVDLSGVPTSHAAFETISRRQYGRTAAILSYGGRPTMIWLHRRVSTRSAQRCFAESGLIGALLGSAENGGTPQGFPAARL